MSLLRGLARAYLVDRMLRGGRRRYGGRYRPYGPPSPWYGRRPPWYAPRPRRRTGFLGPLPYYSARTRGGSRVTVTGCCLPIPLAMVTAAGLLLRLLRRR